MSDDRSNGGRDGRSPEDTPAAAGGGPARLRAVRGPLDGGVAPPPVRLLREYKGPTVADVLRDEVAGRLPGQLRSALHHLRRGDYAAADRAVPGAFTEVLAGPGSRRRRRLLWVLVTAVLSAATLASRWF